MSKLSPLTAFIVNMMKCPTEALAKGDPAKLAAKYGIAEEHAAGYIRLELETRGHVQYKKAA